MSRLRLTVRVIPEEAYLSLVHPQSFRAQFTERKFRVVVNDTRNTSIGALVRQIEDTYRRNYQELLGTVKYIKDDEDDVDLDPYMPVYDAFIDAGKEAIDQSDQRAVIKIIQDRGFAVREGSVVPDLAPFQFQPQPRLPVPIFSQSQPVAVSGQPRLPHSRPPVPSFSQGQQSSKRRRDSAFSPVDDHQVEHHHVAQRKRLGSPEPRKSIEGGEASYVNAAHFSVHGASPILVHDSQMSPRPAAPLTQHLQRSLAEEEPKSESPEAQSTPHAYPLTRVRVPEIHDLDTPAPDHQPKPASEGILNRERHHVEPQSIDRAGASLMQQTPSFERRQRSPSRRPPSRQESMSLDSAKNKLYSSHNRSLTNDGQAVSSHIPMTPPSGASKKAALTTTKSIGSHLRSKSTASPAQQALSGSKKFVADISRRSFPSAAESDIDDSQMSPRSKRATSQRAGDDDSNAKRTALNGRATPIPKRSKVRPREVANLIDGGGILLDSSRKRRRNEIQYEFSECVPGLDDIDESELHQEVEELQQGGDISEDESKSNSTEISYSAEKESNGISNHDTHITIPSNELREQEYVSGSNMAVEPTNTLRSASRNENETDSNSDKENIDTHLGNESFSGQRHLPSRIVDMNNILVESDVAYQTSGLPSPGPEVRQEEDTTAEASNMSTDVTRKHQNSMDIFNDIDADKEFSKPRARTSEQELSTKELADAEALQQLTSIAGPSSEEQPVEDGQIRLKAKQTALEPSPLPKALKGRPKVAGQVKAAARKTLEDNDVISQLTREDISGENSSANPIAIDGDSPGAQLSQSLLLASNEELEHETAKPVVKSPRKKKTGLASPLGQASMATEKAHSETSRKTPNSPARDRKGSTNISGMEVDVWAVTTESPKRGKRKTKAKTIKAMDSSRVPDSDVECIGERITLEESEAERPPPNTRRMGLTSNPRKSQQAPPNQQDPSLSKSMATKNRTVGRAYSTTPSNPGRGAESFLRKSEPFQIVQTDLGQAEAQETPSRLSNALSENHAEMSLQASFLLGRESSVILVEPPQVKLSPNPGSNNDPSLDKRPKSSGKGTKERKCLSSTGQVSYGEDAEPSVPTIVKRGAGHLKPRSPTGINSNVMAETTALPSPSTTNQAPADDSAVDEEPIPILPPSMTREQYLERKAANKAAPKPLETNKEENVKTKKKTSVALAPNQPTSISNAQGDSAVKKTKKSAKPGVDSTATHQTMANIAGSAIARSFTPVSKDQPASRDRQTPSKPLNDGQEAGVRSTKLKKVGQKQGSQSQSTFEPVLRAASEIRARTTPTPSASSSQLERPSRPPPLNSSGKLRVGISPPAIAAPLKRPMKPQTLVELQAQRAAEAAAAASRFDYKLPSAKTPIQRPVRAMSSIQQSESDSNSESDSDSQMDSDVPGSFAKASRNGNLKKPISRPDPSIREATLSSAEDDDDDDADDEPKTPWKTPRNRAELEEEMKINNAESEKIFRTHRLGWGI